MKTLSSKIKILTMKSENVHSAQKGKHFILGFKIIIVYYYYYYINYYREKEAD